MVPFFWDCPFESPYYFSHSHYSLTSSLPKQRYSYLQTFSPLPPIKVQFRSCNFNIKLSSNSPLLSISILYFSAQQLCIVKPRPHALIYHFNFFTNNLLVYAQATLSSRQLNSKVSFVYLIYITHSYKKVLNAY